MKNVTINVTKDDIAKGTRANGTSCPIALATNRRFRLNTWVGTRFNIGHIQVMTYGDYPEKVKNFMCNFDTSRPVKPFRFTISVPDDLVPKKVKK